MAHLSIHSALMAVASITLLLAAATTPGNQGVLAARTSFPSFGPNVPPNFDSVLSNQHYSPSEPIASNGGNSFAAPALERAVDIALEHVQARLHLGDEDIRVTNTYMSRHTGVTHVYFRQIVNGLDVFNADINVNVDRHGKIVSMGESIYRGPKDHLDLPGDSDSPNTDTDNTNDKDASDDHGDQPITSTQSTDNHQDSNSLWSLLRSVFPGFGQTDKQDTSNRITIVHSTVHTQRIGRLARRNLWGLYSLDEGDAERTVSTKHLLGPKQALLAFSQHIHQKIDQPDQIQLVAGGSVRGQPATTLNNVPYTLSPVPVQPGYLIVEGGRELRLVWDLQTEMTESWYNAHIDARSGRLLQLIDWVSDAVPQTSNLLSDLPVQQTRFSAPPVPRDPPPPAAYRVYPLGTNDPNDGNRQLLKSPADKIASPFGWHQEDKRHSYEDTRGNNVVASENHDGEYGRWRNNYRPKGKKTADGLTFDFPIDLNTDPVDYTDAAITNLFYWNNALHDFFYHYGFTEEAGNFENNNFDRGGRGGDGVIASAQDGSGYNNANFATPPDGGHGKMRMYVWNVVSPYRDGDLEGGIITHEYTHGVSIRLTGGPDNSGCLGWGESGGMGEGWGDFVATILRTRPHDKRTVSFAMGEYANGGTGIRRFPYSTNTTTNPETYAWINKAGYWSVHSKGAVWAGMLYELFWNLVDKHGYTEDWYSASIKHGNTLALQLVMDGMKLQPCRPSFSDSRNAILQADKVLTGGDNECEIWKAFAKRGLGVGARLVGGTPWGGGKRKESFTLPKRCGGEDWIKNA